MPAQEPTASGLTSFTEVPVVDVSGLTSDAPHAQHQVADELGRAAGEVGFLYVTGTGIDPQLFTDLLEVTQRFFSLPLEEKMRIYIGRSSCHRGYVPEGEEVFAGGTRDRKEAYDCGLELPPDDPDVLAGTPFLGPNQWPDLPGFEAAITAWYDAGWRSGAGCCAASRWRWGRNRSCSMRLSRSRQASCGCCTTPTTPMPPTPSASGRTPTMSASRCSSPPHPASRC